MARDRRKKYAPEPEGALEIDGIPTAAGLVKMGLAHRRIDFAGRRYIQITDEGHQKIGDAMRALVARDAERGVRHTVRGKVYPDEQ